MVWHIISQVILIILLVASHDCDLPNLAKIVSMIRKYHNHKQQTTPWHCEEEPDTNHVTPGRQIKQSNQLSLLRQDDCKTRREKSNVQQNIEQLQSPTTE